MEYPDKIFDENQLEEMLSRPSVETIDLFRRLDGDVIILGIAGKIGPSLARMARRACDAAKVKKRIIGVSRFRSPGEQKQIEGYGIETIRGDLLDEKFITGLPKVKNVFFLAGMKFGSEENLPLTWAVNSYMPALIAGYFRDSRIVAFSTGCVYPLAPVNSKGSSETDMPAPIGEYAQSCLGRERMFEYNSSKYNTPTTIIRLNYAVEMRYGVLVDIALKIKDHLPVDLSMGYFNVIWQGDSNNMVLQSIGNAHSPPWIVNITGTEIFSVRDIAGEFGKLFETKPLFMGKEANTALLSDSSKATGLFGAPKVPVNIIIRWIASWIKENKRLLDKPTHFEVRDGKY
jgi:nucleoside-diphosphate-sugar epimerase